MAPPRKHVSRNRKTVLSNFTQFWHRIRGLHYEKIIKDVLFKPDCIWIVALLLLVGEVIVNLFVIWQRNYTEIDWRAYMQEVEGVVNGTYDYMKLKGDTGPLVYPAGFVHVYTLLYYITNEGVNIRTAQYVFAALYILTLVVVFDIYQKANRVPPYVLFFMCCASYRIHSIYVLRLFNDPVAMFLLYLSIDLMLYNHWSWSCYIFSVAVSVKMNILLFSPALLLVLLYSQGIFGAFKHILLCAVVQVLIGLPFLLANPVGYIMRSFDFGRKFLYEWTVNWRLLPEDVFLSRYFHTGLLCCHISVLVIFGVLWCRKLGGRATLLQWKRNARLDPHLILLPMFTANFIGIAFSRSLHYQFYVWYFHSLHYLLWSCSSISTVIRLFLLGVIEMAWYTYPSTVYSSAALHLCHLTMLVALWWEIWTPLNKKCIANNKTANKKS